MAQIWLSLGLPRGDAQGLRRQHLVMPAEGIEYTVVNGEVSYEHGKQSGTLAGEMIRSVA